MFLKGCTYFLIFESFGTVVGNYAAVLCRLIEICYSSRHNIKGDRQVRQSCNAVTNIQESDQTPTTSGQSYKCDYDHFSLVKSPQFSILRKLKIVRIEVDSKKSIACREPVCRETTGPPQSSQTEKSSFRFQIVGLISRDRRKFFTLQSSAILNPCPMSQAK